jgi:tetratricopeptide (TPR) repeat protein
LDSGGQPLNDAMKWQIQIARAQSRLIQHDAVLDANPALADRLLNEAHTLVTQLVNAYEGASVTIRSQRTVAAYAYFIAGRIRESTGDVARAWTLYQRAQSLAPASDVRLQAELAARMAQVETLLGNVCAAAKQYRLASQYNICPQSRQDITDAIQDFQNACATATHQP